MDQELAGKVAIITGGASGIGKATAELFVTQGAKVVIADLNAERGVALAQALGDSVAFKSTDVASAEQVEELVHFTVAHFGGLHIMFNNAGVSSSFRRLLRNNLSDFDRVMGVNLLGVIVGSQCAARHMAEYGAVPIVYRVSKAAVIQFTRSAATDLAEYGIRVNCVAPGHIPTGITNYDLGPVIERTQPLQREGSPTDVANAVLFLASERAAQVTGIVLPVDGGTAAGPPANQAARLVMQSDGGGS
jgi:NAD(P)-dependent dehydrogenase (short-subunit alcohol dehydrogenase family)